MFPRAIKMAFWVYYDHLGKLIIANVMLSLAVLLPGSFAMAALASGDAGLRLFVGVPLLVLTLGVVWPLMAAGLAHMLRILIETRDGSLRDFFDGMRLFGARAAGLGMLFVALFTGLAVCVWFYATKLAEFPWLGYGLAAVAMWGLVFTALASLYAIPALVQKKAGVFASLRLASLLALDNPRFTIGIALHALFIAIVSAAPPVLFFLSGSALLTLVSAAYEMLARKYAALQFERDGAVPPHPIHTVSHGGKLVFDDAGDDYLNRTFRDFLFPWKG